MPTGPLTIYNTLSVSDVIYDKAGNSDNWNNTYTAVSPNSGNWNSVYSSVCALSTSWSYDAGTLVQSNSANWDSVFATVSTLSASWEGSADIIPTVTNYLSTNNVLLSSVTVAGKLSATTNLTRAGVNIGYLPASGPANLVTGDIFISNGEFYWRDSASTKRALRADEQVININCTVSGPDALTISKNSSPGGCLTINNTTVYGHSLRINDEVSDTTPFIVSSDGSVGINTPTPNERLTVVGNISSTGSITASASNIPVNVSDLSVNKVFTNADTNKIFHFDTTSGALTASLPGVLTDGFNVAIMNTGTNYLHISSNIQYNAVGDKLIDRYSGAYVYKSNSQIFAVGGV